MFWKSYCVCKIWFYLASLRLVEYRKLQNLILLTVASCFFSVGAYIQPQALDSLKWCMDVNPCKVTAPWFYTISWLH